MLFFSVTFTLTRATSQKILLSDTDRDKWQVCVDDPSLPFHLVGGGYGYTKATVVASTILVLEIPFQLETKLLLQTQKRDYR